MTLETLLSSAPDRGSAERSSFCSILEDQARRILTDCAVDRDDSITSSILKEIALVLTQIDQTRDLHARLEKRLTRSECYIDTELIQMEQRTPTYSPYRFPERDKLQRRLLAVEQERRRLMLREADSLRTMHDRLLSLLNKHRQLTT